MSSTGYTAEIINLSPNTTEKDIYDYLSFCGDIQHVEILRSGEGCSAYVTFKDAHAADTAALLSGAQIGDQSVLIIRHGHYDDDDFDKWNGPSWNMEGEDSSMYETHADPFLFSPGQAVTVTQEVVKTMVSRGYVISKDASYSAFEGSYRVSAMAFAKFADLSNRIGLTDKISAGVGVVKAVDKRVHVSDATKYVARSVVQSSYFSRGAFWVSGALARAAKVAADLGSLGNKKVKKVC
ncbi:hypothetical protein ACHQM5_008164 [Ranunculus cassubicifolius]